MVLNISVEIRTLSTLLLLRCLLCAAGDKTVTLQEVEGTTITLHTGITGIQSDAQILWFYGPEKGEEKILNSQVFNGKTVTEISERFKERLQLDRTSGALTIRNISRNLSGVYLLQVLTGRLSSRTFSVSVYAPVSAPVIRNQRGNRSMSSTEPCFLLCSVENGEDVKLSWYRENERISITNNTDLSVPLNLTLQIEHTENNRNSYICVSANPASNKATSLNIAQLCNDNSGQTDHSHSLLPVLISTGVFLLLLISIPVWVWLKRKHNKLLKKLGELTYTEVEFTARSAERVKKVNISVKLLKMIMRLNVSVVLAVKKNGTSSTGVIKSPPDSETEISCCL
ncbi:signaling lymphocytic activation molecule-like [Neoarius graeffei]|uniref:signaling lymphocytic activation molecule-like n=1 Tax=Neoarius graeffei TaxID=443677 RepID=UPI00298C5993|nr:signaling lymphocytic activation molecule-like [Neoarius graeffei]